MLVPKDVLIPVETITGRNFVLSKPPVAKMAFQEKGDTTAPVIEKYLFENVKCMDTIRQVDITVKDLGIDPAKFPAGTAVEFDGLNFGLYNDKKESMHVWLAASAVRPVVKSADKA